MENHIMLLLKRFDGNQALYYSINKDEEEFVNINKEKNSCIETYTSENTNIEYFRVTKQGIEIAKQKGKSKGKSLQYHVNAIGKNKVIYDEIIKLLKQK